jgi:DNA-binding SARP family transcriptional activator
LLSRLAGPDVAPVVLLEAPPGYGKSWLARRAAGPDVLRLRGGLGPINERGWTDETVLLDDAHLLCPLELAEVAERIEDASGGARLIIAGRVLADILHEATHLVDGLIVDADALAIEAEEVAAELPGGSMTLARRIVEAADGSVRVIATSLDQIQRDESTDPIAVASRMVRVASEAVLQHLTPREHAVIALLARTPGIDPHLLDKLAGDGFVGRAVAVGVPLRRQVTGALDLASASAFRAAPIDAGTAGALAAELLERGRALEAVGLLLDAGDVDQATAMVLTLSESVTDTVEPRQMLSLLARLGPVADREPALLLLRASATRSLGRVDEAVADIDRAVTMAKSSTPPLQRRVSIESARARLAEGRREQAGQIAERTLIELDDGEDRTYARVHEVLAECAATSDAREDLQRAAEHYRVAAAAWESCGEYARARACRRDLALSVLSPLGRYDEALAQVGQLLGTADLSDAERSWTLMVEGFVLFNANRLDAAEARFMRLADLGYVHDNPRLIAVAAWGRALVASRRGDLAATLRWIGSAENTALGVADDVLGVPFLCDMATVLGGLGELELATSFLNRATERQPVFPGQVASTAWVLEARKGRVERLEDGLAHTLPASWWRVKLVAALAMARQGDLDSARRLADDANRELMALGFSDAASLGEAKAWLELQVALQHVSGEDVADAEVAERHEGRRLVVIGEPMAIYESGTVTGIPPGNPQRLIGVLVANGGSVTIDQISEALWPGDELDVSRSRLRNVLLRLRRATGDVVVRTGAGLRLAPGLACDLHEFERLASDALATARADPELAGELAAQAVAIGDGPLFVDFEYDEWANTARRSTDLQMITLLDLLSVQAEDAGDLPVAQALAERALRLDRYADSRYVRIADLLTMQNRVAAAVAVLDDAAAVAREIGATSSGATERQRGELLRRTATGP